MRTEYSWMSDSGLIEHIKLHEERLRKLQRDMQHENDILYDMKKEVERRRNDTQRERRDISV